MLAQNHARTPGRNIHKARPENTVFHGPLTGGAKSRGHASRTPKTLQPQRTLKDSTLSHVLPKPTAAAPKPLFDKTPFPNRISTSPLSSTRKHIRVPRSASRSFETPPNKGNHWEANYIGISLQEAQAQAIVEVEEGKEDYEEIEYMPPRPIEPPYTPPFEFELPDYKQLGRTLLELTHPYPIADSPPQFDYVHEVPFATDCHLLLPELDDDDPFEEALKKPVASAKTTATVRRPVATTSANTSTKSAKPPIIHARTVSQPIRSTTTTSAERRAGSSLSVPTITRKPGLSSMERRTLHTRTVPKPIRSTTKVVGSSSLSVRKPALPSSRPRRADDIVLSFGCADSVAAMIGEDFKFEV